MSVSSSIRIDDLLNSPCSSPLSPASSVSSSSSSDYSVDDLNETSPPSTTAVVKKEIVKFPPQIIILKNLEPLELAKKKHYIPTQSTHRIQKKTGNPKPQGRPFNDSLCARFLFFETVDDLITTVLNHKDQDTVRLIDKMPVSFDDFADNDINQFDDLKFNGNEYSSTIKTLVDNSLNMNIKSPENINFQLQSIEFEKFSKNNIHSELCQIFGTHEFSFVKIIRNNKGKLVKFEILSNVDNDEIDINFIKKYVTYPRYKSKMKMYLINGKFDKNVWFYNDLRMLLWDIKNLSFSDKRVLVNNLILR